jgi:hypothetical protein
MRFDKPRAIIEYVGIPHHITTAAIAATSISHTFWRQPMKTKLLRWISVFMLAVMMASMGGCYGSFELVKKVYKFNGTLGNKFVNELGFLVMTIVPVYSVAGFIDVVVLNSIEFWSGKNPATASTDKVILLDATASMTLRGADGSILLTSKTENGAVQYVFEKSADGTIVKDINGKTLGRCTMTDDGGMRIYDGNNNLVADCPASQVQHLAEVAANVH